ncbi:MAG: KdsC family phosphatase [Gemmataceae bacterium]
MTDSDDLNTRVQRIRWLLLDVDGVLTDGSILYADNSVEIKRFHVRDGSGLKLWQLAGNKAAIVSGRTSETVSIRAAELGIAPVLQGRSDKRPAWDEFLQTTNAQPHEVCGIGDDLPDWPVLGQCGVRVAVADACPELRGAADYVTQTLGGHGAVRETIEWLLKIQGRWEPLLERFRPARP